jgi:hypothetical protein
MLADHLVEIYPDASAALMPDRSWGPQAEGSLAWPKLQYPYRRYMEAGNRERAGMPGRRRSAPVPTQQGPGHQGEPDA